MNILHVLQMLQIQMIVDGFMEQEIYAIIQITSPATITHFTPFTPFTHFSPFTRFAQITQITQIKRIQHFTSFMKIMEPRKKK
jgi:hypothetical protein